MRTEKTHDVKTSIGLLFIAICLVMGLVMAAIVPYILDQMGVLHLGSAKTGVIHVSMDKLGGFGAAGGLFGAINGVVLAVDRKHWWKGLVIALVPFGAFGALAASAVPPPYSGTSNFITFIFIPCIISMDCLAVHRFIWSRYQRPISR